MAEISLLQVTRESVTYAESVVTMTRAQIEEELVILNEKTAKLSQEAPPDVEAIKRLFEEEKQKAIAEAEEFIARHNAEADEVNLRSSLLNALLTEIKKKDPQEVSEDNATERQAELPLETTVE